MRKKREVPASIRLRYTCLTCGKLYMGRIENHYRKFPDHRRQPLIASSSDSPIYQSSSYSTIKTLSETGSLKSGSDTDLIKTEMTNSVLSPIPGTQASETNGEPSLPMETLTTQTGGVHGDQQPTLQLQQIPPFPQAPQIGGDFVGPTDTSTPVKRGPGRTKKRGRRSRGAGSTRGGRRPAAAKEKPPSSDTRPTGIAMLEKVRCKSIIITLLSHFCL